MPPSVRPELRVTALVCLLRVPSICVTTEHAQIWIPQAWPLWACPVPWQQPYSVEVFPSCWDLCPPCSSSLWHRTVRRSCSPLWCCHMLGISERPSHRLHFPPNVSRTMWVAEVQQGSSARNSDLSIWRLSSHLSLPSPPCLASWASRQRDVSVNWLISPSYRLSGHEGLQEGLLSHQAQQQAFEARAGREEYPPQTDRWGEVGAQTADWHQAHQVGKQPSCPADPRIGSVATVDIHSLHLQPAPWCLLATYLQSRWMASYFVPKIACSLSPSISQILEISLDSRVRTKGIGLYVRSCGLVNYGDNKSTLLLCSQMFGSDASLLL